MNSEIVAQRLILLLMGISGYWLVYIPRGLYYYGFIGTVNLTIMLLLGLWVIYRKRPVNNGYTPSVTVLIPMKNEEDGIYGVIEAYSRVDYPGSLLQVIVINDGSTDRSLEEALRAKEAFSWLRFTVMDLPINVGKRQALIEGLTQAEGNIIIVNDSDTIIGRDSLRPLMQPLADPRVGGVSGHARVINEDYNLLTKMQAVSYEYAYAVERNVQSLFGTVECLAGTLSAIRREAFLQVLPEWRIRNPPLGEDRSLTYLLLKHGWRTDYAPDAVVHTIVPYSFTGYLSQQIRWGKGFIMESYRGLFFMWRLPPLMALLYYLQYLLAVFAPWALLRVWVLGCTTVSHLLIVAAWWGLSLSLRGLVSHRFSLKGLWFNLYAPIAMLVEVWRIPLVMLTVKPQEKWMRPAGLAPKDFLSPLGSRPST